MNTNTLFCTLTSVSIANFIGTAKAFVCYAGPGIQIEPAKAMVEVVQRLGPAMVTVCVDFDERVMRMGYGDLEAVKLLRDAEIIVGSVAGLRTALVVVDGDGFIFTPTALYLEAEPNNQAAPNAMRLSRQQVAEALARLSPVAKAIAVAQASTPEEKQRINDLPLEVKSIKVDTQEFKKVDASLKEAPPVQFDLARQVRVFEPFLQYVELSLTGAAIQRHRLSIPTSIQKLGGTKEIEARLHTTFELIEKSSKLSSKPLEDELNEIRKNLTRSMGKDHGRVVLKAAKPRLMERMDEFRKRLEAHQKAVKTGLQQHLTDSRQQIVEYYLPRVIENPPDALRGQIFTPKPSDEDAKLWLDVELNKIFPSAESLIQEMRLEVHFKDVTFETLNRDDFLESIKAAYPNLNWDKTYHDFKAAGEDESKQKKA
ncbi:MAG: hypothetical protein NTX45_15055 [Proteobacteria bacterium]|nr:hypothetical protein [Pseudomonadota bacterium]